MKKNIFCKTIIFFVLALVFSCSQDPIFYTISTEPKPEKPRIQGGPTNMVEFRRGTVPVMYVASGRLHWYAKAGKGTGNAGWNADEYSIPNKPENRDDCKVIGLAATSDHLYALCIIGTGKETVLWRIGPDDEKWQNVESGTGGRYTLVQSVFADKDRLFAGAMNSDGRDFGILYLDDASDPLKPVLKLLEIKDNTGQSVNTKMLSGAASLSGVHYLSTRGNGVYRVAEAALSSAAGPSESDVIRLKDFNEPANESKQNRLFMSMIQLNDNGPIIVIERDGGTFFEVRGSEFKPLMYSSTKTAVVSGKYATGALAIWQNANDEKEKILVAGIQGGLYSTTTTSSYSHGYIEIELDKDFSFDTGGWLVLNNKRPSISPDVTVDHNFDRYTATIGKHPINYMYQTSKDIDEKRTFFASTQTAGLWSFRKREGGLQWNAEGEDEPKNEP